MAGTERLIEFIFERFQQVVGYTALLGSIEEVAGFAAHNQCANEPDINHVLVAAGGALRDHAELFACCRLKRNQVACQEGENNCKYFDHLASRSVKEHLIISDITLQTLWLILENRAPELVGLILFTMG